MSERFAEGANYSVDLDGSMAVCRVWSRPDLDSATGAALAHEKTFLFRRLASGPAAAMLFDLSNAPAVTGPKTQAALGAMLAAFEGASKPIAILAGPQPIQQLQLRRLQVAHAPSSGAVFTTPAEALAWLAERRALPAPG